MGKFNLKLHLDRIIYGGLIRQIAVLLLVTLLVFFIAVALIVWLFGDSIGYAAGAEGRPLWQLYYYFVDSGNQVSMASESTDAMRWIAFIVGTLGSIFLGGLLISTITNMMRQRVDTCRQGFNYYKFKDHILIIGSDQMIKGLVNQLCETTDSRIVIMTSQDVEALRNSLQAALKGKGRNGRVIVNYGVRDSEDYLSKVNVAQAKEVYILGDNGNFDEIESFNDSLNVQCLTTIARLCEKAGRRGLECHVAFDYKTTYHVFQYADLGARITEFVKFRPFNFCDLWARKVLVAGYSDEDGITYKPLDYRPITSRDSDEYVHLIIIGMSKMGQAIGLQAAHIAHFPNYRRRKTRITFIDRNCLEEMDKFKQKCGELFAVSHSTYIDADKWAAEERMNGSETSANMSMYVKEFHIAKEYSHLVDGLSADIDRDFIDVEWTFIKGDDGNPMVRQLLRQYVADKEAIVTVAVCLNRTHVSLRSAIHLPKEYYEKDVPILVQQRKTSSLVSVLNGKDQSDDERLRLRYKNVRPFGMVYDGYDVTLASSLEICMRINAAYCYFFENDAIPPTIDSEEAARKWENVRTSKQWSNIFAGSSVPTKMRCIGVVWDVKNPKKIEPFTNEQIEMLAEIEHNRWNVEELLLGYRPVTEEEDRMIDADKSLKKEKKEHYIHYDIRPYDRLKTDEKGRPANKYDVMLVRSLPVILSSRSGF